MKVWLFHYYPVPTLHIQDSSPLSLTFSPLSDPAHYPQLDPIHFPMLQIITQDLITFISCIINDSITWGYKYTTHQGQTKGRKVQLGNMMVITNENIGAGHKTSGEEKKDMTTVFNQQFVCSSVMGLPSINRNWPHKWCLLCVIMTYQFVRYLYQAAVRTCHSSTHRYYLKAWHLLLLLEWYHIQDHTITSTIPVLWKSSLKSFPISPHAGCYSTSWPCGMSYSHHTWQFRCETNWIAVCNSGRIPFHSKPAGTLRECFRKHWLYCNFSMSHFVTFQMSWHLHIGTKKCPGNSYWPWRCSLNDIYTYIYVYRFSTGSFIIWC